MDTVITVNNLSKKYQLSHLRGGGYITLRDILGNVIRDPVSALSYRFNDWSGKISKEEFWALKNVCFTINRGEAVGIIGSNGAGKSTLLKILNRIVYPTSGTAEIVGNVSSLLEVGTGFHPELTGRENIFLNGAILGMKQIEIRKKFDAIVEFAGVTKFIDTPVKHFSSGMYVRLAFAVAAHMDPDILLIDEVLAVGDAAFQKKCLGKMDEVTKKDGRTVLFVSHNMDAIQKLCQKVIFLENGRIKQIGPSKEVVENYLSGQNLAGVDLSKIRNRKGEGKIKLNSFYVENEKENKIPYLTTGGDFTLCFGYGSSYTKIKNLSVTVQFNHTDGKPISMGWTKYTNQDFQSAPGNGIIKFKIKQKFPLAEGLYQVGARIACDQGSDWIKNIGIIEVREGDFFGSGFIDNHAPVYFDQDWKVFKK